jgi:tetratricopeptide (TPR) repeat protein
MNSLKSYEQNPQALERYRAAKAFFNNGEFFRSYDLAREAFEALPEQLGLAHLAVLSLADAGAVEIALEKFGAFGLDRSRDPEARALLARLNKDLGFAAHGAQRLAFHEKARAIYHEVYEEACRLAANPGEAYYPGINAATMALWCGDRAGSAALAMEVLSLLETLRRDDSPADRYWRLATETEAWLILGRLDEVEARLGQVRTLGMANYAQVATTVRQLRRIAGAIGVGEGFLGGLALPAVMHFSGHIIAAAGKTGRFRAEEEDAVRAGIAKLLAAENVGAGYGSLAAGADILFAEELLARGGALHVILPFAVAEFIEVSVANAGKGWVERFQSCLASARSVRYATEDAFLHHDRLFQYCSHLAMGLAILAARHMQTRVLQGVVWDGVATAGIAGTVSDIQAWRRTGHPQYTVRCGDPSREDDLADVCVTTPAVRGPGREIRAMLFGDLHGFSKLTDRELPLFASHIMKPFSEVVRKFRERTSFVNTWGDGIFVVLESVCDAAEWALTLQERMSQIDYRQAGLPAELQLRLGGHLGPVYQLRDPILGRTNFYGSHVSRAARIEPVTPEGCIYVTETFAAILALNDSERFACDYAGYTELAKHYGRLRVFLLRRASGDQGPVALGDIERPPLQT